MSVPRLLACLTMPGCVEADQAAIERGVVIAARPVEQAGENTGAGAVVGTVIGAALGAGLGGREVGQVLAATASAVVGGTVGSAAEGAGQSLNGIEYTVRLGGGRVVTVVEHRSGSDPLPGVGAVVAVETRGRRQHVIAIAAIGPPTAP